MTIGQRRDLLFVVLIKEADSEDGRLRPCIGDAALAS